MTQLYTPAPWHVEQSEDDLVVRSGDGAEICEVTGETFDEWAEEEREANAALIAAAPELLTALKELLEAYTDICGIDALEAHPETTVGKARSVIIKAEGVEL